MCNNFFKLELKSIIDAWPYNWHTFNKETLYLHVSLLDEWLM